MNESQDEKLKNFTSSAEILLEKYFEEANEDIQVDQLTILERLEDLPSIVNKWLKRRFDHKRKVRKLIRKRYELMEKKDKMLSDSEEASIYYKGLKNKSEREKNKKIEDISDGRVIFLEKYDPLILKMRIEIEDYEDLSEYCEKMAKNCSFTLKESCTNIIKLRELEG